MKAWDKNGTQNNISNIEEIFFRTMLIISLIGSCVTLLFDIVFETQIDGATLLMNSVFIFVTVLTLFFLSQLPFRYVAILNIIMVNFVVTYRGLFAEGNLQITATLLITLAFIASLITRGVGRDVLKIMIAVSMLLVLSKDYREVESLVLVRQAIPYIVIFLIVTVSSTILKNSYENNQHQLSTLVTLLDQKRSTIEIQHDRLLRSYERLARLNKNLTQVVEEKTKNLEEKNQQLSDIAFTSTHNMRAPLARIIGLLQLIALDPQHTGTYLIRIDNEANEMDETVQGVVNSIEARASR
jgi:signal transduction histidine kinase